ncbi:MAG: class I SAM-dependent methyltransferase [Bacteroidetes bacterium]|nr:class I SAM-dependent methyltransferase [Bacteroidota bacterium]
MSTEQVFTEIYRSKHWKSTDNVSGPGSEINQTETLIRELNVLFKELNIVSVLDIPCGNFHWMQKVDLSKIKYVGADIVTELIESNKQNYQESDRLNFQVLNLITNPLPQCDLIIVRDCLVHFSNKDILNAITIIKSSGSKYLLTTTFTNHHMNFDIVTGDWRPLNLQDKPFNFAPPLMIINENCTECNGEFKDKSMALWEISKL